MKEACVIATLCLNLCLKICKVLVIPVLSFGQRYCQELWIGGAWLGGFLPIFFVFTAFDLNTINKRNTSTHQG